MIPVPSIEYVNVRVRGAGSRLFGKNVYEDILTGDTLATMTTFLLDQPWYRPDIERALEDLPEREALERGVTDHFVRSINDIFSMAQGRVRALFMNALVPFDIRNLRALVVAHIKHDGTAAALTTFVPCGSLTQEVLIGALAQPTLADMATYLTARCPLYGTALSRALKDVKDDEPLAGLVNRIERHAYRAVMDSFTKNDPDTAFIRHLLRLDIDLRNIRSALKIVVAGLPLNQQRPDLFIAGGTLPAGTIDAIANADTLDAAFELIEGTPYHPAVEKGIIYFAETEFIHEMERFFEEEYIHRAQARRRNDPFGVGMFVGYVWRLYAEMTNLRTVINGIAFRAAVNQIRKGLVYV